MSRKARSGEQCNSRLSAIGHGSKSDAGYRSLGEIIAIINRKATLEGLRILSFSCKRGLFVKDISVHDPWQDQHELLRTGDTELNKKKISWHRLLGNALILFPVSPKGERR